MGKEYHYIPSISIEKVSSIDYTISYSQTISEDTNTNYYDFSNNGPKTISIYADNITTQKLNNLIFTGPTSMYGSNSNITFETNYRLLEFGKWAFYAITTTENTVPSYLRLGTAQTNFNNALAEQIAALAVLTSAYNTLNDASNNYWAAVATYNADLQYLKVDADNLTAVINQYNAASATYDLDYAIYLSTDISLNNAINDLSTSEGVLFSEMILLNQADSALVTATSNYTNQLGVFYNGVNYFYNNQGPTYSGIYNDINNYYQSVNNLYDVQNYYWAATNLEVNQNYMQDFTVASNEVNILFNGLSSLNNLISNIIDQRSNVLDDINNIFTLSYTLLEDVKSWVNYVISELNASYFFANSDLFPPLDQLVNDIDGIFYISEWIQNSYLNSGGDIYTAYVNIFNMANYVNSSGIIATIQSTLGIIEGIYQYGGDQEVTRYTEIFAGLTNIASSFSSFIGTLYLCNPSSFFSIVNGDCSPRSINIQESFNNFYNNSQGINSNIIQYYTDATLAYDAASSYLGTLPPGNVNNIPDAKNARDVNYTTLLNAYNDAFAQLNSQYQNLTPAEIAFNQAVAYKISILVLVNQYLNDLNTKNSLLQQTLINKNAALAQVQIDLGILNNLKDSLEEEIQFYETAVHKETADQTAIQLAANALDNAYQIWGEALSDYNVKNRVMLDLSANLNLAQIQEAQAACNATTATNLEKISNISYALFDTYCSSEPTNTIQRNYNPTFVNIKGTDPPNPPNLWSRATLTCDTYDENEIEMRRKAEVLKYKDNQNSLSKKQQWSTIVNGNGSLGKKVWATQNDVESNPNVFNLPQVENTLIACPTNNTNSIKCEPSSASDVPGNSVLCYDPAVPLVNYANPQRTYQAGGTKWPESSWIEGDNGFPVGKKGYII